MSTVATLTSLAQERGLSVQQRDEKHLFRDGTWHPVTLFDICREGNVSFTLAKLTVEEWIDDAWLVHEMDKVKA